MTTADRADFVGEPGLAAARTVSGVVVADADALLGTALLRALDARPTLVGLGWAGDADGLLELVESADGDVGLAVVSSHLPPRGATDACRRVLAVAPHVRVLVLAPTQDHAVLLEALEGGASGLVSKDGRLADVVHGVEAVLRGEACVPRRMLGGLLHELIQRRRHGDDAVERYASLSRREREVLALLGQGLDQDEIARRLVISPQTSRTHIQNVLGKLGMHSRVEAATFAVAHGFTGVG